MTTLSPELLSRTKINIGCGYDQRADYLNVDVDEACKPDFLVKNHDLSVLPQRHYEELLAHDVLEHIPHAFTMAALLDWASLLKDGGRLVLQTSYLPGVVQQMAKSPSFETEFNWMTCLFGNQVHPGDFHHICFTESTLKTYLVAAGFEVPEFTFADLWLIRCEAVKVRDCSELVRLDLDTADFVRNAYAAVLKRSEDEAMVTQLASELAGEAERVKFVRHLTASPENLYRIGKSIEAGDPFSLVKKNNPDPRAEHDLDLPFAAADVFRGWAREDMPLIERLTVKDVDSQSDVYTDSVGVRVLPDYCPWIAGGVGTVDSAKVLPNSYCGDGIEYASLAYSLEWARSKEQFVVGEIGAGWAPWTSAATVIARRFGFEATTCVCVEADPSRFATLRRHLAVNEIVPSDAPLIGGSGATSWRLWNAACDSNDGVLYWPVREDVHDAGMRPTNDPTNATDYRGLETQFVEVPAVSLNTAFDGVDRVDFLHIDLQGAEMDLLAGSGSFLNDRVVCLFVGTHSRSIEGAIIDQLSASGWTLIREKPCQFYPMSPAPTLPARTWYDGGQFWRNERFF